MATVYLDSCIVIYLVEKHPQYFARLVAQVQKNVQSRFVVSSLTALEVLVKHRPLFPTLSREGRGGKTNICVSPIN